MMKKLLFGIICTILLGGCASTKVLEPNLSIEPLKSEKHPYTVAIDGTKLVNQAVTARPGAVELTVVYGDAFLESIRHRIKETFKNVYIIKTQTDKIEYDYIVHISNNILSMCGATSCGMISNSFLNINDSKGKIIVLDKDIVDNFVWSEPGSAVALGIFTGLTLLVTAPITVPIGVHIENEELGLQVSNSNDRVAVKVAEAILDVVKNGGKESKPNDSVTNRLEKLKELQSNGLITKEDFEKKQKEILDSL